MRLGGESKLGVAQMGGDPYWLSPGYVCDRLVIALSRFKMVNGVGVVKTIRRLAGDLGDQAAIDRHLFDGLPAYLVWYQGGTFTNHNTQRTQYTVSSTYSILCLASDWQGKHERQQGRSIYEPSTDNLMTWATYFCTRELQSIELIRTARPVNHQYIRWITGQYIGKVDFEVLSQADILDDDNDLDARLERLGIVHSPLDLDQLFQGDNQTPNSSEPSAIDGGVYELGDE